MQIFTCQGNQEITELGGKIAHLEALLVIESPLRLLHRNM